MTFLPLLEELPTIFSSGHFLNWIELLYLLNPKGSHKFSANSLIEHRLCFAHSVFLALHSSSCLHVLSQNNFMH